MKTKKKLLGIGGIILALIVVLGIGLYFGKQMEESEGSVLVKGLTHTYDGKEKEVSVKRLLFSPEVVDITYYQNDAEVDSCIKAGSYQVEIKLQKNSEEEILNKTMTIQPKELKLSGMTPLDKHYDGKTEIVYEGTGVLEGVVTGDDVSVESVFMNTKTALYGVAKKVFLEVSLQGKDAGNYKVEDGSYEVDIYPVANGFLLEPILEKDKIVGFEVIGYNGSERSVVIPTEFDNLPILNVSSACFKNNETIEAITFPENVSFERNALKGCKNLKCVTLGETGFALTPVFKGDTISSFKVSGYAGKGGAVEIPSSVGSIPVTGVSEYLFAGNGNVKEIVIPASIKEIGLAFAQNATALKKVIFKDRTSDISWGKDDYGTWAFAGSSVESITIGKGMTTIPEIFATGAEKLTTVVLGEDVKEIKSEAFRNCTSLTMVKGYKDNMKVANNAFEMLVGEFAYVPTIKDEKFVAYTVTGFGGIEAKIPSMVGTIPVTAIASYVFAGHETVTSITIPASVTKIGLAVAQDAGKLKTVVFEDRTSDISWEKDDYGTWAFAGSGVESIIIGKGMTTIPEIFATGAEKLTTVVLGEDVKEIKSEAFRNCTSLTMVKGYKDNMKVANNAFEMLVGEFAYVPTIKDEKFVAYTVTGFGGIEAKIPSMVGTIPVTAIASYVFAGHETVTSITIPASVTKIGLAVAQDAGKLKTVVFEDRTSDISWEKDDYGTWAFAGSSVESIIIGKGMTAIPEIFATGAEKLTAVCFGENVEKIKAEAFKNCTALTTVNGYKDSIKVANNAFEMLIGDFAFVPTIENEKFTAYRVTGFGGTEAKIPSAIGTVPVTAIEDYVFAGHETVTSITIPSSVTKIGLAVAQNASKLKRVVFEDRTSDITWKKDDFGTWAFAGSGVESIVIGKGMTSVPEIFATGAEKLNTVTFGENTTVVSAEAFKNCVSLVNVNGYSNLENIAGNAFEMNVNGFALQPTVVEDKIAGYTAVAFSGTEANVPNTVGTVPVTTLANHLFAGNAQVTSITIPSNVTYVGLAIAQNTSALKTVVFEEREQDIVWGKDTFGAWTFAGSSVESITIGKGITTIPEIFATGAEKLNTVTFGENTTVVSAEAFKNCVSLVNVNGYSNLENIAGNAFEMNVNGFALQPTVVEDKIAGYTAVAFSGTEANVPNTVGTVPVTTLANHLFAGNAQVTSITIPSNVTYVGLAIAQNTSALKTVVFEEREQDIVWGKDTFGAWTFAGSSVESITIGKGITTIPEIFATGAGKLTTVTLGNTITSIGSEAFKQCGALKNIVLPNSLQYIGSFAFFETGVEKIVIPANVNRMGCAVFQGTTALEEVIFVDRTQNITFETDAMGSWMFFLCNNLKKITIGNGIKGLPAIFAPTSASTLYLGENFETLNSESLPAVGTVTTLYIDSPTIAAGLNGQDAYYGVFKNVSKIGLKDGLVPSQYITSTYTNVDNVDGYVIYSK